MPVPPDPNGDIGPTRYVQWVNLSYAIFDRAGNRVLGPSAGNTPWAQFADPICATTNQGDPVVRYDRMADRWIFTQFAFNTDRRGNPVAPFEQCFAVSTTGDPAGPYNRYSWNTGNAGFPDYPKLGVWPDGYYMSVNIFQGNTFVGGGALVFDRIHMIGGQAATAQGFGPLGAAYGGLLPSDLDGSILPPAGSPNYFGAIDTNVAPSGNTLQLWKFHVDWANSANSTFGTATNTPNFNLTVATYRWFLCNGSRSCIPQPGTSVGLDAIPDRLMNRLQYRRFADGHESLVANHTVGVGSSGNQAAIRFYEIRNLSSTPTIYQQGTYAATTDNRWMGSMAMDQAGDITLGYSVSSSTVFPSIRYTGRLASDTLGTLPQGEAPIVDGAGSQTTNFSRWGDYSMMAVDPVDDCTFWYTQEYYAATSDRGWQTRIASFRFPVCGPPAVAGVSPTSGPSAGGTAVTITGSNFSTAPGGSTVKFGTNAASNVACGSTTSCTATSPQGNVGTVDVTVTTALGTSALISADQFTYAPTPCTSAALQASPGSPQPVGTVVTLTGSASPCTSPQYRFWLRPASGSWAIAQDFSSNATFVWSTAGLTAGTYYIELDVHETGDSGREGYATLSYDLGSGQAACTGAGLQASAGSPQPVGTSVTLTGSATGCTSPQYRFWIRPASGTWSIAQDYSTTATYVWNTTGLAVGTYYVEVDVHATGSSAREAYATLSYDLGNGQAACTGAGLQASPGSPQAVGTTVTLTGSATGCSSPQYRFWIRPATGTWAIAQDYSTTATYVWNTTGLAVGTYYVEVDVHATGSSAREAYAVLTYIFN